MTNHSIVSNLVKVNGNHEKSKKKNKTCNETEKNRKPEKKLVKSLNVVKSQHKNKTEKDLKPHEKNGTDKHKNHDGHKNKTVDNYKRKNKTSVHD